MALACAQAPHVVVSHLSAGRLWGLRRLGRDDRLHVTMNGRSNCVVPGAAVHRSHRIDEIDVVDRDDGIRLTSPPRTVFDLAAMLHDDAVASIIEQLLHEERCTVPTLFETGRRLGERGRTGSARFARVLQSRPALLKPVASDLESLDGLSSTPVCQGRCASRRSSCARARSSTRTSTGRMSEALEVDHVTWHGGKLDLTYDSAAIASLWQLGVHVSRVTDDEIRHHLGRIVADLRTILRPSRAG